MGSFETGKSSYGLYDMAGNAMEWVADWYEKDYYSHSSLRNPVAPEPTDSWKHAKVARGGAWHSDPFFVRSASRQSFRFSSETPASTDYAFYAVGFRCVQDVL